MTRDVGQIAPECAITLERENNAPERLPEHLAITLGCTQGQNSTTNNQQLHSKTTNALIKLPTITHERNKGLKHVFLYAVRHHVFIVPFFYGCVNLIVLGMHVAAQILITLNT